VALDPEWLPDTFDVEGTNLTSVLVPRSSRSELVFLSDEHFRGNFRKAAFPAAAVAAEAADAPRAPIHFVFHTSHCCSTLLAKALEVPGTTSLLNEPNVMINLANRLIRNDDKANRERLELGLRLLERPLAPGETVIVKPSNFANRSIDAVLTSRPNSRAVLLYSDLETLLLSLVKRGLFGRIFGRRLFNQIKDWSPLDFGYGQADLMEQTDVQVAALAWLMQIHHFDRLARAFKDQVVVLDASSLLADPVATLQRVQQLFEMGLEQAGIEAIASGPVFSKHSKSLGEDYSAEARERDYIAAAEAHSEEIGMVLEWIKAVAAEVGAPLRPG